MTKANNILRKIDFSFGLVCLLLLFCLLIICTVREIEDLDIWLHLKTGELISINKTVPHYDTYSFTYSGNKWIDHEWLFQVIAYSFYNKWQASGLLFMQALVVFLTFLIFILIGYRAREYLICIVPLVFCLLVYRSRFGIRPEMFSMLFFAVYILIIDKYLNRKWYPFVLIPIQIIWVNMHGFFFLGPLLILFVISSDFIKSRLSLPWQWNDTNKLSNNSRKKLKWIFLVLILVCLINPYFLEGALYPIRILSGLFSKSGLFFKHIIELKAPITGRNIFSITHSSYLSYYIVLIALSLMSFGLNFKRIDIFNITTWTVFLILSSVSVRNIGYFCFIAYFAFLKNMTTSSLTKNKIQSFLKEKIKYTIKWIIVILILFLIIREASRFFNMKYYLFDQNVMRRPIGGFSDIAYPEGAVDFILENNIKGNIYNEFNSGAYLIGRCYPQLKVFIDGRTEVYGSSFFKKYVDISDGNMSLFDEQLNNYDISAVLLNSIFFEISKVILNHLYKEPDWRLVYFDEFAVIFLKDVEENKDIIDKFEIDLSKWQTQKADLKKIGSQKVGPYPYINRAYTLYGLELYSQAIQEAKEAIRIQSDSLEAYKLLGVIYHEQKLYTEAFENLRIGSIFHPKDTETRSNLGVVYAELGDFKEAQEELEKAIKSNPYYSESYYNLALLFKKTDDNKKAIKLLKRAVKLKPLNAKYLFELGTVYFKDKNFKLAYNSYKRALELTPDSAEIHNNLGLTLYEMGRFKEAGREYKKAIEINKDFAPAYNSLGVLYGSINEFDKAKHYWLEGLKLDPENLEIKSNLKKLDHIKLKKNK